MTIKQLTLEEAHGTINSVIITEFFNNPHITKKEMYNFLLNSSVKELVLKVLPTFEIFTDYLPTKNFNIKN